MIRPFLALIALGAAFTLPQTASSRTQTSSLSEILAKASSALGAQGKSWTATGTSTLHGAKGPFVLQFDSKSRFRTDQAGELPQRDGYDGKICWTDGPSLAPHPVGMFGKEVELVSTWVITGQWVEEGLPLHRTLKKADTSTIEIGLETGDGTVPGNLILNAKTYLPLSLSYQSPAGKETWTFSEFQKFGEREFPSRFIHRAGAQDDLFSFAKAEEAPGEIDFSSPIEKGSVTDFTKTEIPVKRVQGYLFVQPKVDGRDVGWFFLDTGADVMCIDPKVAKGLSAREVGADTTAGVVGVTQLKICKTHSFELGPTKLTEPVFAEFDELGQIGDALGIKIAGICGYDFIARTGLDIDPGKSVIGCFRPGSSPVSPAWRHVLFGSDTPILECGFAPDHKGLFSLDTGSNSTVDFFSTAVTKYDLLKGKDLESATTGGAGGSTESKTGSIEWFELGSKRFVKPQVVYQIAKKGLFSTGYYTGNIGSGFISKFRLLLDYPNERVGFIPTAKS